MIDFSKGGYKGDPVEEMFKGFTAQYMPYWWHFREVLRASHLSSIHWQKQAGGQLSNEEAKDLVAISLIMYQVYTCLAESISFTEQLEHELNRSTLHSTRHFEVKKNWKAAYSSLYSSLNAVCNLLLIVAGNLPIVQQKKNSNEVMNYSPGYAFTFFKDRNPSLSALVKTCQDRLEIRNHLDHYWLIWLKIERGSFLLDDNFKKGYVVTEQTPNSQNWIDARRRLHQDILGTAKDFNTFFQELANSGGYLDQYLTSKDLKIDYSDYGMPHNGRRPLP